MAVIYNIFLSQEMRINYHKRRFKVIHQSENAEVDEDLIFEYRQVENRLSCEYAGASIKQGHLLGLVDEAGRISMHYHQINLAGELSSGKCLSSPELMANGKIRLHESWQWTSGDQSKGESILEEL